MFDINELNDKLVSELREIAKTFGVGNADDLRKAELIAKIKEQHELISAAKSAGAIEEIKEEKPKKRARTVKTTTTVEEVKPKSPVKEASLFDNTESESNTPSEASAGEKRLRKAAPVKEAATVSETPLVTNAPVEEQKKYGK